MPRAAPLPLLVLLGAALAIGMSACGEEDAQLLPGGTAREITANLETVERLADEGDCLGAEGAALQVSEQVEGLSGVDARLKRALRDGAERLQEVVAGCTEELEAVEPPPPPTDELEGDEEKELEKEREKAEKEEEKEQREEEKEEAEGDDEGDEGSPPLPPQAEGEEGGAPSGGVSPANPAGEG